MKGNQKYFSVLFHGGHWFCIFGKLPRPSTSIYYLKGDVSCSYKIFCLFLSRVGNQFTVSVTNLPNEKGCLYQDLFYVSVTSHVSPNIMDTKEPFFSYKL